MRVLVTGATGCLGGGLTEALLAQGYEVIAQGRDPLLVAKLQEKGAQIWRHDLRDPLPENALKGVGVVYHCAALSSAWGRAEAFESINVTATDNLLKAARAADVRRFIFASSPSIYANGMDLLNISEDHPIPARHKTHYAASKYRAERLVLQSDDPNGMRTLALRPRAIYGRGDRALMPRLLTAIERGKVPLIDGGKALTDLTHLQDAALAMRLAGEADHLGGRAYNISSGQAWHFYDILDAVCEMKNKQPKRIALSYPVAFALASSLEVAHRLFAPEKEPILTRQAVVSMGRSMVLDISAARQDLGYEPRVTLAEGIADYA